MSFWKARQSTITSESSAVIIIYSRANADELPHALGATRLLPHTSLLSACNRIPHKLCTGLCQAAILCTVCFSILCGKSDQTALFGGTAKELTPLPDIVPFYKVLVLESGVCTPVYPFSIFDRSR